MQVLEPEPPADLWRRFHDNLGLICILLMVYLLFNTICLVLLGFKRYELSEGLGRNSPARLLNAALRSLAATDILTTTLAFTYFWSDRRWERRLYWVMEDLCAALQTTNDAVIVALALMALSWDWAQLVPPARQGEAAAALSEPSRSPSQSSWGEAEEGGWAALLAGGPAVWLRYRWAVLRWGVWGWALLCAVPNLAVLLAPEPGDSLGREVAFWRDVILALFNYFVVAASVAILLLRRSPDKTQSNVEEPRDLYVPVLLGVFLLTRFPAFSLALFLFRVPVPHYSANASAGFLFTELNIVEYWLKIALHFVLNLAYTELVTCCNWRRSLRSFRALMEAEEEGELRKPLVQDPSFHRLAHTQPVVLSQPPAYQPPTLFSPP